MSVQRYTLSLEAAAQTSTKKTALMLIPGSAKPVTITSIHVSVDAAVYTEIELVESTQATNGTAGTDQASNIKQVGNFTAGDTTAPSTGARSAYTSEPTVLTALYIWRMSGTFVIQFPLGREPQSLLSGSTKYKGIGLRIKSASNVNADITVEFEE